MRKNVEPLRWLLRAREVFLLLFKRDQFKKYNLKHGLLNLIRGTRDDFYWNFYTDHYLRELELISKSFSQIIETGDYAFLSGDLRKVTESTPLHPNHRLLYETVLQCSPLTVFEVGCGRGDHLHNLSVLSPHIGLYGVDISRRQVALLKRTYPALRATTEVFDISCSPSMLGFPRVDLVYTQAVLMHIHERDTYERALQNIFSIAGSVVVLMENWTRHDFLEDITSLYSRRKLAWKELYCYYRISPELKKPHLMILANRKLPYAPLNDYSILKTPTDNTDN